MFQMSTASDAVIGAMRHTRAKRARSRQRRSSGLMLSVTIEPQKMSTSRAPAKAKSSAVSGESPPVRPLARFAEYAGTSPQVGPSQTAASRPRTNGG